MISAFFIFNAAILNAALKVLIQSLLRTGVFVLESKRCLLFRANCCATRCQICQGLLATTNYRIKFSAKLFWKICQTPSCSCYQHDFVLFQMNGLFGIAATRSNMTGLMTGSYGAMRQSYSAVMILCDVKCAILLL